MGMCLGARLGCAPPEGLAPDAPPASGRAAPPETAGAAAHQPAAPAERPWTPPTFAERQGERDEMVRVIRDGYGLRDEAVLKAMGAVPRHEFVPPAYAAQAYADRPLPTAHGQTISQPYIVAEMTRQLRLQRGEKVLEVGTGSGYQAAVLTHFTTQVYTIEIIRPLADSAAERLKRLGYRAVQVRSGDGFFGWPEAAPFDAILVTFTVDKVPEALLAQLKPGGRMVVPVAGTDGMEWLTVIEKPSAGEVTSRRLFPVRFVPLLREDPSRR
jgi:protein-L-isoaspartate(D-aspartate) O-methyltransferase